ncbi:uncharacterized protein LOC131842852, partial [Achroia grisella]|uniref:uncharacterized protein LOC131842852 n=1 Tax=Achroia grisella TaxID=688607 RepID=UPI0027D27C5A
RQLRRSIIQYKSVGPGPRDGEDDEEWTVTVSAVSADGAAASGEALAQLAALRVRAAGVRARVVPPPPACAASPAEGACAAAALRALAAGELHAALLPVPAAAAPAAPELRDAGLEELGDAAPPARRACLASRPPLRSLLDLADAAAALPYRLPPRRLEAAARVFCESTDCSVDEFTPDYCIGENSTCATLLTSDTGEVKILEDVIRKHELRARVVALGPHLANVTEALAARRAVLVCDRAPALTALARLDASPLGPPPCDAEEVCPFEPRRLIKLANARSLARTPSALRVLTRLHLDTQDLRELGIQANTIGPLPAAEALIKKRLQVMLPGEVRTAVLLPLNTSRQAYDARALIAAATLAEQDLEEEAAPNMARFKTELTDDGCSAPQAYKYLTDALGTGEYGALSAVAGPACGAAFADVVRLSPAHMMPVLAYTAQAPPPAPATELTLLAAGDARLYAESFAALMAHYEWRRLAVLSEPATRAFFDGTRLQTDVIIHVELPDSGPDVQYELIKQWADRVASANAKIVYACLEDARSVRAALCAGGAAGLTPAAGAVWLLPGALPDGWLAPGAGDRHGCSRRRLEQLAEGHLSAAPRWQADWEDGEDGEGGEGGADDARADAWRGRLRARCAACARPPASAALLYDVTRLWAAALRRLLAAHPAALDDLHRPELVRALIENVTEGEYSGLTGRFSWTRAGGAVSRSSGVVLRQWAGGARRRVGAWRRGALALDAAALRWTTPDGRAPDDGAPRCGLQPLADFLHSDCRAAFIVLSSLLLAALISTLVGVVLHCKRRAELEYRARLAALDMRTFGLKPGGLDRWELPRERVVINRKLGTGAFGTVYGGHALLAEDRGWTAVAVKTLKAGATTEEKLDFLSEAEAMKRFDHKNIIRLLGVVTKTEPVCTVMEFMLYGDLKNYLLARRHLAGGGGGGGGEEDAAEEVSARQLTSMALDAARALSYLAQLRYVHRDVAARNCLVSAHRVLKLADFGMTRLVFENDYYRFSRKGMLPVRWMAPESLALGVFSPASDVWSFGVLLYEIVTFGSLPFQGLSNSEVLARVKAGQTLELPSGLKPQLEGLIKSCWQQEFRARPGAAEVAAFLADCPRLLAPCLDVPLDALPLDADAWRLPRDRAEARWVSWAAPPSAATDTTYLSADAPPPDEADAFLA